MYTVGLKYSCLLCMGTNPWWCECTRYLPHTLLLDWETLLQMKYLLMVQEPKTRIHFEFCFWQPHLWGLTLSATNEQWKWRDEPEMERMLMGFSLTLLFLILTFCRHTTLIALGKEKNHHCFQWGTTTSWQPYQSPKSRSGGSNNRLPWLSVIRLLWKYSITKYNFFQLLKWIVPNRSHLFFDMVCNGLNRFPFRLPDVLAWADCRRVTKTEWRINKQVWYAKEGISYFCHGSLPKQPKSEGELAL